MTRPGAPTDRLRPAGTAGSEPMVSIVIVNFRRPADTIACLESLRVLAWPSEKLEIVVVDNASGDGSAARIRAGLPKRS